MIRQKLLKRHAAGNPIRVGWVGAGRMITGAICQTALMKGMCNAVICDIRAERREAVKGMADRRYGNKDCAMYRDFYELLARPDIDAVLIATGDRWHTLASIIAGPARQGHVLREALLHDDRREQGPRRHGAPHPSRRA